MRFHRWLLPALLLLSIAAGFAVACGGSGNGRASLDLSQVPTATPPDSLPAPIIVGETTAPVSGATYVVVAGDSPASIAAQFGVPVDELMEVNGITDPTALAVGQELIIPGVAGPGDSEVLGATEEPTSTPAPVVEEPEPEPPVEGQIYIVQAGDIPETIAAQFGITAEELMAANGITDPTTLQIGDELIIPTPSAQ